MVPQQVDKEAMMTPAMEKYKWDVQVRLGVQEQDFIDDSDGEEEQADKSDGEQESEQEADDRAVKIYDRKAGDSGRNEDLAFTQQRLQALERMSRRGRHLMIYSNVTTSDFLDMNQNNIAKAWAVLYHFRGKTTETMLYEEFNALA